MRKIKNKKIIVFTIYILSTLFLSFFHENWRDEAQAYLLVKNLDLIGLFKNAYLEGHPILYYYLLYPFVKIGFNFKILNIISLLFMDLSVYILLFKINVNKYLKLMIICSYTFMYEYSIVGRSYAILTFLTILITYYYKYRENNKILYSILLGLLLNTHLFMVAFSILTFFIPIIDKIRNKEKFDKKDYISIFIYILFMILLFMQCYKMIGNTNGMTLKGKNIFLDTICNIFIIPIALFNNPISIFCTFGFIFTFYSLYVFYKKDKKIFIIVFFSYIFIALLNAKIYGNGVSTHHACILLLLLLFGYSNIDYRFNKNENIFVVIVIVTELISSLSVYKNEYLYRYTDSKKLANFIENNIKKGITIYTISEADAMSEALMLYLDDYKFFNLNSNKYYKYIVWNKEREKDIGYRKLYNLFKKNNKSYFLMYKKQEKEQKYKKIYNKISNDFKLKIIYNTDEYVGSEENFKLYLVTSK